MDICSLKEELIPIIRTKYNLATIGTSSVPVNSSKIIDDILYYDMETYAIENIVSRYDIPRIYLKVPWDIIWDKLDLPSLLRWIEDIKNIDLDNLEDIMLQYKGNNLHEDLFEYKEKYKLTFSEFEIFKKNLLKIRGLTWKWIADLGFMSLQNKIDLFKQINIIIEDNLKENA